MRKFLAFGLIAVVIAVAAGGGFFWGRTRPEEIKRPNTDPSRFVVGDKGPWGQLEYTRIAIEPPDGFFIESNFTPPNWFFPNLSLVKFTDMLQQSGLSQKQQTELLTTAFPTNSGVLTKPTAAWIFEMPAAAREKIYSILATHPDNPQNLPFSFRPEWLQERLDDSELSKSTVALFRKLLYPRSYLLLFADMETVLSQLPDHRERLRFYKMVSRKNTYLVELRVNAETDVAAVASYWGINGRAKDIEPLLDSLKRVPHGCTLDIGHLLPSFPRRLIYTFPFPSSNPAEARRDCNWTSLNFFSNQPDDRFVDAQTVLNAIQSEYSETVEKPHLGDLALLMSASNSVVHSAVYLADDLVFTKNGAIYTQPWMYVRLPNLLAYYSSFYPASEKLRVVFFRRRALPQSP